MYISRPKLYHNARKGASMLLQKLLVLGRTVLFRIFKCLRLIRYFKFFDIHIYFIYYLVTCKWCHHPSSTMRH